jgi:hypothetical protein
MNLSRRPDGWVLALARFILAGCATHKIDWASRVGNYPLDPTVTELGPPDKQAKLSDGSLVADCLTRRGRSAIYATSCSGAPGWPYYASAQVGSGTPVFFLRLNFAPNGRLTAWKKFAR